MFEYVGLDGPAHPSKTILWPCVTCFPSVIGFVHMSVVPSTDLKARVKKWEIRFLDVVYVGRGAKGMGCGWGLDIPSLHLSAMIPTVVNLSCENCCTISPRPKKKTKKTRYAIFAQDRWMDGWTNRPDCRDAFLTRESGQGQHLSRVVRPKIYRIYKNVGHTKMYRTYKNVKRSTDRWTGRQRDKRT